MLVMCLLRERVDTLSALTLSVSLSRITFRVESRALARGRENAVIKV